METKEVVAIVVHELGHIYHTHLLKIACTVIIYVIFLLAIFSYVYREKSFVEPFGYSHQSDFVYVFLFATVYEPIDFFVTCL